jgi:PAS domain S-box-containing protein
MLARRASAMDDPRPRGPRPRIGSACRAYLLQLHEALKPLADPVEIHATATRLLGERLGVNQVAYFEVVGSDYVVERDYTRDAESLSGQHPIASFGDAPLAFHRSGRHAKSCDVAADTTLSAQEHAAYAAIQVGAYISVPLIKNGEFVAGLAVRSRTPRRWTSEDLILVEATAERIWAVVARAKAERALHESDARFRLMADTVPALLWENDANGAIFVNARYLEFFGVNFEGVRGTGWMKFLHPDDAEAHTRSYLAAFRERRPFAADCRLRSADGNYRWIHSVGKPLGVDHFVGCSIDVTETRRREENLAFLNEVSRELVSLTSLRKTMDIIGARIGEYLQICRCAFAEIDEVADEASFEYEWHREGMSSIAGRYRMQDFLSAEVRSCLREEMDFVVDDVRTDARVNATSFSSLGIEALVFIPVVKDGQLRFALIVHNAKARDWREDEVDLLHRLTVRIWVGLERARTDEALRVSEERHRALFEQTIVGVAELDLSGTFVNANRRYCEILGYSAREMAGMPMQQVSHPQDLPETQTRLACLIHDGEPFEIEKRCVRKTGEPVWVHYSVSPVRDGTGRMRGIVCVCLDITLRKRQQEELRHGKELLDFLIDRSPAGFFIVDADFRISHMNAESKARAFRNIDPATGRSFDEAMRVLWPEPLASEVIQIFRHTLETGEPYKSLGLVGQRADTGRTETYDWQLERITMPDGRLGVVCYYYDTTRLRQVEQELRDADRRKDEFLATLAHELRNPLAPIRNSLHILRLGGSDSGTAKRVHDMMERQVSHMVHLVDDLMEVSRITRGKIELRKEPVDLGSVVHNAVETSRPLIEAAGHHLEIALSAERLTLEGDAVRLAQVLTNLLNNAAKYTESSGHMWLTAYRDGAHAVVSVRDDGIGIPPAMLTKVFDLFAQADGTYGRAQGGLGIGLTLVRSLVGLHGGSVEARSDGPGRGSEFVVRLPLMAGALAVRQPEAHRPPAEALTDLGILVVDDNRDSAYSLCMLLQHLGADVHTADGGNAALEAMRIHHPAVVLLDIGMPEMDGYEVARRARLRPEGRDAMLIALTGWGQEEDRRRSREAGFDHHMVKPLDLVALQELLGEYRATH